MARKTTIKNQPADDLVGSTEMDLENAIDDLRGALKADEEGTLLSPDTDVFGASTSDFGASDFGSGNFGASDFGASDFGGTSDFGGSSDFGSGDLGASDFGNGFGGAASMTAASGDAEPAVYDADANHTMIMDIPIDVQIVLGASRMPVKSLMALKEGTTITLDKKIGEPVDITVNGRLIARGEITLLEDDDTRFGVKLTELSGASKS